MNNLCIPPPPHAAGSGEFSETLFRAAGNVRVERVISHGHATPDGQWYDQEQDEWVAVITGEAVIGYDGGGETRLGAGDHVLIPKHVRHRVLRTSSPCVWLTVFGDSLM